MPIKSFQEFLAEGKKGLTNAGSIMKTDNVTDVTTSINFADETMEILRRKLLDKYFPAAEGDDEKKENINKCISTFVYCLDKKMRIDEDIIKLLATTVGKTHKEISKELEDSINTHYGKSMNLYGVT